MTLDQAHAVVQFYGEHHEIRNLWEILDHMKANWKDLDQQERKSLDLLSQDLYVGITNAKFNKKGNTTIIEDDGYAD